MSPTPNARSEDQDLSLKRDAQARLAAQTRFDTPYVLEAGAGTGKTATLTARLLAWSLGPGWRRGERRHPGASDFLLAADITDRILAVTFTEKAAAEMSTRLSEGLLTLQRGKLPVGVLAEALPGDKELWSLRARALLASVDRVRISTLHSFCHGLLREHPLEAGVHPQMEVDADGTAVQREVRALMEERLPFLYTDRSESNPALKLASKSIDPEKIALALETLAQKAVAPEDLLFEPFSPARLQSMKQELTATLKEFLDAGGHRLSAVTRGKAAQHIDTLVALNNLAGRLPSRDALDELVERISSPALEKVQTKLRYWAKPKFTKAESAALEPTPLGPFLTSTVRLSETLAHLKSLDPPLLEAALAVLAPLYEALAERLTFRGIVTFDALISKATALLTTRSEVTSELRGHLDQILVDEFQDTNHQQCQLLEALALQGPRHERPGLFLVGDPKQSIYGWRRAELSAYEAFKEAVSQASGQESVGTLTMNYRSVPAILQEVQRLVAPVMQREPRLQPPFEPLMACPAKSEEPPFTAAGRAAVEHWISSPLKDDGTFQTTGHKIAATDMEARALARDIAGLHHAGVPFGEVALLLRSTSDMEVYGEALRKAAIPYVVTSSKSYYRRREILEAAAAVRCVLDPHDTLALLSVLRSPLVGVPDNALIPLWSQRLPGLVADIDGPSLKTSKRIQAVVLSAAKNTPPSPLGSHPPSRWTRTLIDTLEGIATLRKTFHDEPAGRFVELMRRRLLNEPTEAARHLGAYRAANLELFFYELESTLEANHGDVPSALRELRRSVNEDRDAREASPPSDGRDAVQILTIHKAKGLDFTHVFVGQCHKETQSGGGATTEVVRQVPLGATTSSRSIQTAPENVEAVLFGAPTWGYLKKKVHRKEVERRELVRLFYVALTRAKSRLVVMGARGKPLGSAKDNGSSRETRRLGARDLSTLLAFRSPPPPINRLAGGDPTSEHRDPFDVKWRLLAQDSQESALKELPSEEAVSSEDLLTNAQEFSESLARWASAARERMKRPFHMGITSLISPAQATAASSARSVQEDSFLTNTDAPTPQRERLNGDEDGVRTRQVASAAGTAVHSALELWDFKKNHKRSCPTT